MLKAIKNFLIFAILISASLAVMASDTLLSFISEGKEVELVYRRGAKELVLSVSKRGRRRNLVEEKFDISNPSSLDAHIARSFSVLQGQGILEPDIERVSSLLEEFKFVSTANCQAIHLGEEVTSDTRAIEDLASEFDRISAGIRGEGDFERSVELFEVRVPDIGSFQIRALVDSNGRAVKLSLSQDGGTLKDFKVERVGDIFTLSSPGGKPLLTIQNHGMENKLISLSAHGKDGLETQVRTHIKLDSVERKLEATIVATSSKVVAERIGAVQLTSVSIEHRPVVRHSQMNIFIPTLEPEVLRNRVSSLPFGEDALENQSFESQATSIYDACLAEAYVLRRELGLASSDDKLVRNCLVRLSLELADDEFLNDSVKSNEFRSCLSSAGIINTVGGNRSFNQTFFELDDLAKIQVCKTNFIERSLRTKVEALTLSSFQNEDESFIPLASRVSEIAMQAFRACQGSNCQEVALRTANIEIFKLNFLKWFIDTNAVHSSAKRDELVASFDGCVTSKTLNFCQKDLIAKSVVILSGRMYENIAKESGLNGITASALDSQTINQCVQSNLDRVVNNNFAGVDEWRYRCSFEHFKQKLPLLTEAHWAKKLERYTIDRPIASVVDSIESTLINILTTTDAKEAIEKASITAYSAALSDFVNSRLNKRLPIVSDESVYQAASHEQVRERLGAMTEPGSYQLNESTATYLSSAYQSRGMAGLQTSFNDIVMRAHIVPRQYELVSNLSPTLKDDQALESQVNALVSDYEACWNSFDANGEEGVIDFGIKCDKESAAAENFTLVSQQMRDFVSRRYPLASQEANEILAPLYYMDKCFKDGDPLNNKSYGDYQKWINACAAVTRIDIASNLFEKLESKYKPVLSSNDQQAIHSKLACFSRPLQSILGEEPTRWFGPSFQAPQSLANSRSVDQILQASNIMSGAGSLLSAMFTQENFDQTYKESDRTVLHGYLDDLSQVDEEKLSSIMTGVDACISSFDESVSKGFRAYLVNSIPSLYSRLIPVLNNSQKQVVEEIIDVELAQLLLAVQAKSEYRVIESDTPGGTIVTSEFTIQALARFIEGMGSYISQGFVFDMDEMKTELAIFKEELKDALRWVVESNEPVSLDELSRFFSESKLADHMALAHVAKNTNKNFQAFLSSMYDKEVSDFWDRVKESNSGFFSWIVGREQNYLSSTQKTELKEIEKKYESLKSLSHRMTSGYDFRRIFNVHNEEGRAALDLIKQSEFMPRLTGRTPSALNESQVDEAIAKRILADNTAGGFSERFVREMAQEYLTKQSRSKWAITKWLFYDSGDFDWEVVRETPSGRKAIEYYGRYVLLPKMLGQNLSRYSENIHKRKFEELLREAQSEN